MIKHIKNQEVDRERWNNLVQNSIYSDVYAFSWFLDIVCPDWEALILNDYEAIFPLPIKRKCIFEYIVQPVYSQRYSIYSTRILLDEEKEAFYKQILLFKSVRICLSQRISAKDICRKNITLDLSQPYETIQKSYNENTLRNIHKAKKKDIHCSILDDKNEALQYLLKMDKNRIYTSYLPQLQKLIQQNIFEAYGATYNGEICAVAFFAKTKTKIYYLFPVSSRIGKQHSAMFLIIDTIIQKYSNCNLQLDFEGSEIEGVRHFYEGFGGTIEEYYFVNRKFSLLQQN